MKYLYSCIICCILFSLQGCVKDSLLDTEPSTILTDDQIWTDPKLVESVLANFYNRLPTHTTLATGWEDYDSYDEAMWSALGNANVEGRNNITSYGFERWRLWNYDLIRDINLAIDNLGQYNSPKITGAQKTQFISELRFLRALNYFELVKRMGGVPLVTTQLIYNSNGDVTPLQIPRSKESDIYDFVASEVDAIKETLGNVAAGAPSQQRATKYTALALKCRAMLYAGSIARYNNKAAFTPITTSGGEVGIPASAANAYYQKSLDAAKEIINSGLFSLYNNNPDKGENFYQALTSKQNKEVIMAIDYLKSKGRVHLFTYNNIARSLREGTEGSSAIAPSLGLVEDFKYIDGTDGALKGVGSGSNTAAGQTNWIFYDNPKDIFANKDPRLYGTIVYPGTTFGGKAVQMQAGVYVWNATANKYDRVEGTVRGSNYTDGKLLIGADGPMRNTLEVSQTGFYLRKYVDQTPGASNSASGSDTWWVWFRLGEVYLNAGEAAFELGLPEAVNYFNAIRQRAGFSAGGLFTPATLNLAEIQRERRVELAFEDHRVWDVKRWRIAHEVWSGQPFATNPKAWITGLYPYRIVRPGNPNDGKYVFDRLVPDRFKAARYFQMGNYYSSIDQNVLNANPKLTRNPFH